MGTSRSPLPTDDDKKLGLRSSNCKVVVQNGNRRHHFIEKFHSTTPGPSSCQLGAHLNFRNRYGGDCDIVLIRNDVIKIELRPLGIDQESCVKNQTSQNRSSATTSSRICFSDSIHWASAGCRLKRDFTSDPRP